MGKISNNHCEIWEVAQLRPIDRLRLRAVGLNCHFVGGNGPRRTSEEIWQLSVTVSHRRVADAASDIRR